MSKRIEMLSRKRLGVISQECDSDGGTQLVSLPKDELQSLIYEVIWSRAMVRQLKSMWEMSPLSALPKGGNKNDKV